MIRAFQFVVAAGIALNAGDILAQTQEATQTLQAATAASDQPVSVHELHHAKFDTVTIRAPKDDKVLWSGVVNYDKAGMGSGQILYPAPGVLGLLAAVLTHAAIVDSSKRSQKNQIQLDADKILTAYQPVLADHTNRELLQSALEKLAMLGDKKLIDASEKTSAGWVLDSAPALFLTQDQTAIILDHLISLYSSGDTTKPVYQATVRVVSPTHAASDPVAHWTSDSGKPVKQMAAKLVAHSLDIAMADFQKKNTAHALQKTYRYTEGSVDKAERAQLFAQNCEWTVVKTLRGGLLSFPSSASVMHSSTACAPTEKQAASTVQ